MGFDAIYPKGKYLARWEWIAYDLLPLPFLIDHHHRLFRRTYSTGRYRSGDSSSPPFAPSSLPLYTDARFHRYYLGPGLNFSPCHRNFPLYPEPSSLRLSDA